MASLPAGKGFSSAGLLSLFFFCVVVAGFSASGVGEVRAGETPKEIAVDAKGCVARVSDARTGKLYAEAPAHVGSRLFFGWIHSLEKIPWNEYYHVDEQRNLVLDTITFPAFGAGIPADKGRVCRVRDGLIHMEEIEQIFPELVWLNSQTATRDIVLDGKLLVRGADMPHHARVRLIVLPDVDQAKEGTK